MREFGNLEKWRSTRQASRAHPVQLEVEHIVPVLVRGPCARTLGNGGDAGLAKKSKNLATSRHSAREAVNRRTHIHRHSTRGVPVPAR